MFHQHYPGTTFICRLILLRVRFNNRLVTMSIARLSEESSKQPSSRGGSRINADSGAVTGGTGGEKDQAARKFTEEEMTIHRAHREACEVRRIASKTSHPSMSCCSDRLLQLLLINYKQRSHVFIGYHFY